MSDTHDHPPPEMIQLPHVEGTMLQLLAVRDTLLLQLGHSQQLLQERDKTIAELTRELEAANRENAFMRTQLEDREKQGQAAAASPVPKGPTA